MAENDYVFYCVLNGISASYIERNGLLSNAARIKKNVPLFCVNWQSFYLCDCADLYFWLSFVCFVFVFGIFKIFGLTIK